MDETAIELLIMSDFDSDTSESSFSSSTTDSEKEKVNRVSIKNYVEDVVAKYSDVEFKNHFRLNRQTVLFVIQLVREKYSRKSSGGVEEVPVTKAFLMTVWYLSNTESFRQVADRFDVSKSSAHSVIYRMIDCLFNISTQFITWPDENEVKKNVESFARKGINHVLGAIDCTHIEICRPSENQQEYYNRKGYHSIILQGVVDRKKRFIDIFIGEPGSQHDARVLRKSDLYSHVQRSPSALSGSVLLGDSAYPELEWIIPPFKDYGHLTNEQIQFNQAHSSIRVIVEHAFGLLKNRFRRIRKFENINLNFIKKATIVSVMLHNICINQGDDNEVSESDVSEHNIPEPEELQLELVDSGYNISRRQRIFDEMFAE